METMEYHNYFPLKKLSIQYKYFCFIDTKEYFADALFIKHKVRVWFQKEGQKPGTDYIFVFCKIKKEEENQFIEALEDLKKKMMLLGYLDYQKFCEEFYKNMLEQIENGIMEH